MIVRSLRLLSFRAHSETEISFAPKVNLLHGPNGAGKTNIIEALHYLCLTKSFLASQDTYALRQGCPFFEIEGMFEGEQRKELRVRLVYVKEEGKKIFVNGAPLERLSQIVGSLPAVVFSPDDQALTAGGPDERRRFLNNILSQAWPVYLDDVMKYRRAMRQRNELLSQLRKRGLDGGQRALLDSWDAELVLLGSRVVARRLQFLKSFTRFLEEAHGRIEAIAEKPTITYAGIAKLPAEAEEEEVAAIYQRKLESVARRERELGRTLIGPHRDELIFRLDGMEVRRYASQGQHRTFGMALKLAQFFYLRDRLEEPPLLLLDDVFDNLDPQRTRVILDLLQTDTVGQSLITAAQRRPFAEMIAFDVKDHQEMYVEQGRVRVGEAEQL